jgi:hypothetical protein
MKPRLILPPAPRKSRVLRTPLGRFGYTRDKGGGDLFGSLLLSTRLRAIVRDPAGRVIDEIDLGSGKVTNVGALALANDFAIAGVATNPVNLFSLCKWHAWGTGTTEANTDIAVTTLGAPNAANATEGVNTLSTSGVGKPKLISTGKIVAESTLAITEWGLHSRKALIPAEETATAATATSLTATATPYTASSATVQGEQNGVVRAITAEEVWGLITKNTTSVLTVPAWYKVSDGTAGATPSATTKYRIYPVLFDHRKFAAINVVTGNSVEFPWELEVQAGG